MNTSPLKQALLLTLPTVLAYFPLGIVFGVLFTHEGYSWYLAPIMSALVYAGAVQFIALGMMNEHAPILSIVFATSFVALRNSFYGLSFIERFKPMPRLVRFFLMFGLVDATYAILSNKGRQDNDQAFCLYVSLIPYLSWVFGTFLGALLADTVPNIKGLEFILTSFFAILVIEYYLVSKKIDALCVPLIAVFFAYWAWPSYFLIIAMLSCVFYLTLKIKARS